MGHPQCSLLVGMSVAVGVVMAVVVMIVFDLDRWGAAMRDFAVDTFELNGGVVDAELLAQGPVDLLQNTSTLRWRYIGNDDVGGQRVGL